MKIAIDVADLDCERIDGTRVYIQNVLKYLGELSPEDKFFLFHKSEYNKLLKPAEFKNYKDKSLSKGFWWTQFKFARAVRRLQPEVCWMPIQQIPWFNLILRDITLKLKNLKPPHPSLRERTGGDKKTKHQIQDTKYKIPNTEYVVTIHDLAFKFFPNHFPLIDRLKLNLYTDLAVKKADKIIAISETTKQDLIRLYPRIDKGKIKVVYHGFDRENFQQKFSDEEVGEFLKKWKLGQVKSRKSKVKRHDMKELGNREKNNDNERIGEQVDYLLYVGAIQPRKDLITLIKVFEAVKQQDARYKIQETNKIQDIKNKISAQGGPAEGWQNTNLKLILVGEIAWKSESTIEAVENSEFKDDIIMTGKVDFQELALFYRFAKVFVFPSLYEGFGIPLLEAMASKTPVITADNSSLSEVGGSAVLKFKSGDREGLAKEVNKLLKDKGLQEEMVNRGLKRIEKFSWKKCAKKTLEVLKDRKY